MKELNILTAVALAAALQTAAEPPECLQKAAFWVDGTSLVDDGNGGTARWCDVRETDSVTPTRVYAVPAWTNATTTYAGINPSIESVGEIGRTAVNFHGASGQFMRFMKDGAATRITGIRHLFAVHCPSNYFPSIIGEETTNREGALFVYRWSDSYLHDIASGKPLFWFREDLGNLSWTAPSIKVLIDGAEVDPFSYRPKAGFQTFEAEYTSAERLGQAQAFFFQRYEDGKLLNKAGGDWLSEVIVFTNQLSVTELAGIRAYLNVKWAFPLWLNRLTSQSDATGSESGGVWTQTRDWAEYNAIPEKTISASAGEYAISDGETAGPYSFEGTGTVTKTGAGSLAIGPSGPTPFAGTLDLRGGNLLLRGGAPIPMRAVGGRTVDSSDWVPAAAPDGETWHAPDFHGAGGIRLTVSAGASGVFEKTGHGAAHVSSVDSSVTALNVSGGELTLGAPAAVRETSAPVAATIPNADFEEAIPASWYRNRYNQVTGGANPVYHGWRLDGQGSLVRLWPDVEYDGVATGDAYKAWTPCDPLDGKQALMLTLASAATATATFPEDGVYVLSFDATGRRNTDVNHLVHVKMGEDAESLSEISAFVAPYGRWQRIAIRLPFVEAGSRTIQFQTLESDDTATLIDNISIVRRHVAERSAVAVPNGNFERISNADTGNMIPKTLSSQTTADGWTLHVPAGLASHLNPPVAIANPRTATAWDANGTRRIPHGSHSATADGYGVSALMFAGNTGSASTTFTPPSGNWHLRFKMSRVPTHLKVGLASGATAFYNTDASPATIAASVAAGGQQVSLGTVSTGLADIEPMGGYVFPTPFAADGATAITLSVSNTVGDIACYVDDLELVPVATICEDDGELVRDGGFEAAKDVSRGIGKMPSSDESASPWTKFTRDASLRRYNSAESTAYLSWPNHYGYTVYEGLRYLKIQNASGKWQDVTFPSAGCYRFRFALRLRTDSDAFAGNEIVAWLDLGGGRTNTIAWIVTPPSRNYTEYEYLFRIEEPGTHRFGIEGLGQRGGAYDNEGTTAIDGLSIKKATWDIPETAGIPAPTIVSVAEGAGLNLAFTGTNRVAQIFLGGRRVIGVVDSDTYPAYVSGTGALRALADHTVISFR